MVWAGWFEAGGIQGSIPVRKMATVWDGEVAGIQRALEVPEEVDKLLILIDSRVAIAAIRKAERKGKAKTADLVAVVNNIARREAIGGQGTVRHGCQVGIAGNERVNEVANSGASKDE